MLRLPLRDAPGIRFRSYFVFNHPTFFATISIWKQWCRTRHGYILHNIYDCIQVNLIRQQMTLFLSILFTKNERKTSFSIRIYQTSGGSLEITKHYYQWKNINHFWSFIWLMATYSFDALLVRNESVWYGACVHMSCSIRQRACLN